MTQAATDGPPSLEGRLGESIDPYVTERPMPEVQLELAGLTKSFGGVTRVNNVSLRVPKGTVVGLLGPSGCGKTTTLRMIAGLENADSGRIAVDGEPVVDVGEGVALPPHKRQMGMVFQSYAIWPHLTVFQNVAYPLKLRRVPRQERRKRVEKILELVDLAEVIDRPSTSLSGGQQQRVALARALVYEPSLLLLDEPLSNLDTRLRTQMRDEIRGLQRRLGVTVVFVTHDQEEAMSLADTIAVMHDGVIEQHDVPKTLYDQPETPFVRDFLGETLGFAGTVTSMQGAGSTVEVLDASAQGVASVTVDESWRSQVKIERVQQRVLLSSRIEDVHLDSQPMPGAQAIWGRVADRIFVGDHDDYVIEVAGQNLRIEGPRDLDVKVGDLAALNLLGRSLTVWAE